VSTAARIGSLHFVYKSIPFSRGSWVPTIGVSAVSTIEASAQRIIHFPSPSEILTGSEEPVNQVKNMLFVLSRRA